MIYWKDKQLGWSWGDAEHVIPKYATLTCGLFWAEDIKAQQTNQELFTFPLTA